MPRDIETPIGQASATSSTVRAGDPYDMGHSALTIAFVIPNLSGGGAARVATILTREWHAMGHAVHLVTFEDEGATSAYPVADGLFRHQIGLSKSPPGLVGIARNNYQRVRRLSQVFKKMQPDLVIAFLLDANVSSVLANLGSGNRVLVGERNHPGHDKIGGLRTRVRALVYPRAHRVCVQTENIRDWYRDNHSIDAAVIPNPAPERSAPPIAPVMGPKNGARYRAVGLGRLEPQKGLDRLIDAFAEIAPKVPDWDIAVYGEGSLRDDLEARIDESGLTGRFLLPGVTSDPETVLDGADLFVHSARFEGYPNAVIEALSAGLCVVATDCPGATGELLQGGQYGVLSPDAGPDELAAALLSVMGDHSRRTAFAARSTQAVEALQPRAIAQKWIDIALADD